MQSEHQTIQFSEPKISCYDVFFSCQVEQAMKALCDPHKEILNEAWFKGFINNQSSPNNS